MTVFVRDPPPVPELPPLLRSHGRKRKPKTPVKDSSWYVQRGPKPSSKSPKWYSHDLRNAHLIRHRILQERRAAGDYDRPVLTNYARGMIAIHDGRVTSDAVRLAGSWHAGRRVTMLAEMISNNFVDLTGEAGLTAHVTPE